MKKITAIVILMGVALTVILALRVHTVQRRLSQRPTVIMETLKSSIPGYIKAGDYNVNTNVIRIDTFHARRLGLTKDQVLAHEMCHYRQWKENPLRCYLNHLLPYQLRPIEREARNESI